MKEKVADKMQELIKITTNEEGQQLVSARELHGFLEVKSKFNDWFRNRVDKYFFVENEDFIAITKNLVTAQGNNSKYIDYAITIDMAKELSMVENNNKGRQARQYFIACEKKLKNLTTDSYMIQDPVERAKRWIEEEQQRQLLVAQIEKDKPKVLFANAVASSKTSILVGELAKILKQNGVKTGPKRLFTWMRDNGYLIKRKGTDYNMPTQKSMEQGLFEIKETSITHSDGHITVTKTPKVTGKGQQYFINKFVG